MGYLTSATTPPSFEGVAYWERSKDPSHSDAFKGMIAPLQLIVAFGLLGFLRRRREGWMGIDFNDNPVAFVPDETLVRTPMPDHLLIVGRYDNECAFPVPLDLELLSRHIRKESD